MNTLSIPRAALRAVALAVSAVALMVGASAAFGAPSPLVRWAQQAGGSGADTTGGHRIGSDATVAQELRLP